MSLPVRPSGEYKPDYTVSCWRPDFWKVVRFNRSHYDGPPSRFSDDSSVLDDNEKLHDGKWESNLSRARASVLKYSICNDWDWFFTGTLDPVKYDRYTLGRFRDDFAQWVRNLNRKSGFDIKYLIVPEKHKDGAWHLHGLLRGVPQSDLSRFIKGVHPRKLVQNDYWNWERYGNKFGFCSLGRVRDPVRCAFYIQKYLTKSMAAAVSGRGKHMYFNSQRLCTAVRFGDVYGRFSELDGCLTSEHDFCSTGFVRDRDWSFFAGFVEYVGVLPDAVGDDVSVPVELPDDRVPCADWEQMNLFMYG